MEPQPVYLRGPRYPGFPLQLSQARSAELSARRGYGGWGQMSHTHTHTYMNTKRIFGFQWLFIKCKISLAQIKNQTPPSIFNITGWKKKKTWNNITTPFWNPTFRIASPWGWAEGWGKKTALLLISLLGLQAREYTPNTCYSPTGKDCRKAF